MTALKFAPEFIPLILSGHKCMTFRRTKHDVGEMFEIKDQATGRYRSYHITKVERRLLGTVAQKYYSDEGFVSPLEFIGWWSAHYPNEGWNAAIRGWHHTFKDVNHD
jgi:hypothetical protein